MSEYVYLLVCQSNDGTSFVAECDSWCSEIGVLAEVEGQLFEIAAVNHVAVDGDDYRFIAQLHNIKPVTALYRKVYGLIEEDSHDADATDGSSD